MIAKHLLEELPEQVLDYYKAMRIQVRVTCPLVVHWRLLVYIGWKCFVLFIPNLEC